MQKRVSEVKEHGVGERLNSILMDFLVLRAQAHLQVFGKTAQSCS